MLNPEKIHRRQLMARMGKKLKKRVKARDQLGAWKS